MPVRIDEAGQGDHAVGVDPFGAWGLELVADGDDHAIADADIALGQVGDGVIHRQDMGAAQKVFAAHGQAFALVAGRCGPCRISGRVQGPLAVT